MQEENAMFHTRLICYNIYCTVPSDHKETIYDFMPLPGDPKPKDQMKVNKREAMQQLKKNKAYVDQLRKEGRLK